MYLLGNVFYFLLHAPFIIGATASGIAPNPLINILYWVGFAGGLYVWVAIPLFPFGLFLFQKYNGNPSTLRIAMTVGIPYFVIIFILLSVLAAAFGDLFLWFGRVSYSANTQTLWIATAVVVAWLLYVLRCNAMLIYAGFEILTGLGAVIAYSVSSGLQSQLRPIAILGGVYIVIRGLDNFDKSLPQLKAKVSSPRYMSVWIPWERWITLRGSFDENSKAAVREELRNRRTLADARQRAADLVELRRVQKYFADRNWEVYDEKGNLVRPVYRNEASRSHNPLDRR